MDRQPGNRDSSPASTSLAAKDRHQSLCGPVTHPGPHSQQGGTTPPTKTGPPTRPARAAVPPHGPSAPRPYQGQDPRRVRRAHAPQPRRQAGQAASLSRPPTNRPPATHPSARTADGRRPFHGGSAYPRPQPVSLLPPGASHRTQPPPAALWPPCHEIHTMRYARHTARYG